MLGRSSNFKNIIALLVKLKDQTPDYPTDLMAARKAAFMKQVVSINVQVKGLESETGGGSGGGGPGSSGGSGFLGGLSTAHGILLQVAIGVGAIAAILTSTYLFREQIIELLQDNGIVPVEVTQAPSTEPAAPATVAPVTELPLTELPPTELPPTVVVTPAGSPAVGAILEDLNDVQDVPNKLGGLHLGQTPGAPAVPGRGEPNKSNGPGKPEKPEKPEKPDKNNK